MDACPDGLSIGVVKIFAFLGFEQTCLGFYSLMSGLSEAVICKRYLKRAWHQKSVYLTSLTF
jgi:hypothetical protein